MTTEETFNSLYEITLSMAKMEVKRIQRDVPEYDLTDQIQETVEEMLKTIKYMLLKRFMNDIISGG